MMATATVTLKVTPSELKIIEEALALYRWMADLLHRKERGADYQTAPPPITVIDNDLLANKAHVDKLIQALQ